MTALENLQRRTGETWPAAHREQAVALSAGGMDPAEIAAAMGKSEHGVKVVLKTAATRAVADAKRKRRRCLGGCGGAFLSDGPHNRLCERCSGRGTDFDTYGIHLP